MQRRNWAFVDILMAVIDYFILSQFMNLLSVGRSKWNSLSVHLHWIHPSFWCVDGGIWILLHWLALIDAIWIIFRYMKFHHWWWGFSLTDWNWLWMLIGKSTWGSVILLGVSCALIHRSAIRRCLFLFVIQLFMNFQILPEKKTLK